MTDRELDPATCDCGSIDKHGDDIGEHDADCPYHLKALAIYGPLKTNP